MYQGFLKLKIFSFLLLKLLCDSLDMDFILLLHPILLFLHLLS